MHEFHAVGDHDMCNIQNHTILVVQLMQFNKTVHQELLGPWRSHELSEMPSASVLSDSTGNGGAWLKECASLEAADDI
jgi:hypothetical protein